MDLTYIPPPAAPPLHARLVAHALLDTPNTTRSVASKLVSVWSQEINIHLGIVPPRKRM